MSLINKALQRAECDGRRGVGGPVRSIYDQQGWPDDGRGEKDGNSDGAGPPGARDRSGTGIGKAVLLGLIVLGGVGALSYFSQVPGDKPPKTVRADSRTPAMAPADPAPEAADKTAPPAAAPTTQPSHPGSRKPGSPEGPPAAPPEGRAGKYVMAPAPPAARKEPPGPAPQPQAPDTARFKLGGIMQSGGSARAIINNHLVAVGDFIDGATVVSISKHYVVLEVDHKRIHLRL